MATANITVGRVRAIIADEHPDGFSWSRSAWSRGVRRYALDLLADWPYGTPLDAATVGLPRMRGDDPCSPTIGITWQEFAPHARG